MTEVQHLDDHHACAPPGTQHAAARRWGQRRRFPRWGAITIGYIVIVVMVTGLQVLREDVSVETRAPRQDIHTEQDLAGTDVDLMPRSRREVAQNKTASQHHNVTEQCNVRAINNFPDNFLSFQATRQGGVVLHVLIAVYMFLGLAVICDDYFVPALEVMAEDLGMESDVAGATLMAAGSSAPELAVSVVGVFFAKDDIGVGTIVGSAVFNVLFVVGLIGICAGQVLVLSVWPLLRDSLFYMLSVALLFVAVYDQAVMWYESLLMILLYCAYVLLMYCNPRLQPHAHTLGSWVVGRFSQKEAKSFAMNRNSYKSFDDGMDKAVESDDLGQTSPCYDKDEHDPGGNLTEEQTVMEKPDQSTDNETESSSASDSKDSIAKDNESPKSCPEKCWHSFLYIVSFPFMILFCLTVPPVPGRRPPLQSCPGPYSVACVRVRWLSALTFFMSLLWIAVLTYVMVWMITIAGDVLDVPDTVMGLTLVTAGASVPDLLASVLVARDGYGDMAVSNAIGSNSFDILFCLGVVWFIKSASTGWSSIPINSAGLVYSTLTLLATVAFLPASLALNHMRLTPAYGGLCVVLYILVTTLMCLYEVGLIWGGSLLAACPRDS